MGIANAAKRATWTVARSGCKVLDTVHLMAPGSRRHALVLELCSQVALSLVVRVRPLNFVDPVVVSAKYADTSSKRTTAIGNTSRRFRPRTARCASRVRW
jgi:hypothetical protein